MREKSPKQPSRRSIFPFAYKRLGPKVQRPDSLVSTVL